MDGQSSYTRPSPMRNSKAVNRPFESPLRSVISPARQVDKDEKQFRNSNLHSSSPKNLMTPEKRISRQAQLLPKKICQETKQAKVEPESERDEERSVDAVDLKKLRDRISAKRKDLEHLKRQLCYKKKHDSKDLINLTERWLRGCQEALLQFQKDIGQHDGSAVDMTKILAQLGIPPELVQYSIEDCDFL